MSSMNKKTMKKEVQRIDSKSTIPRPSSPTGSVRSIASKTTSTSKSSSSHKSNEKGPSKDILLRANSELHRDVEKLSVENQKLKRTIQAVIDKFIENSKIKGVRIPKEIENPDVSEIPAECLVDLAESLTAEKLDKSNTMEGRVEELETRITHLNMELAKLLQTRVSLENGLEEITESNCLDDIRKKARDLLYETKGSKLFTYLDLDYIKLPEDSNSESSLQNNKGKEEKSDDKNKSQSIMSLVTVTEELDLTPPAKKLPGDTHIRYMHKNLKQYVVQQLSMLKGNGADWRLLAERIGIPQETIQQWKRWKSQSPMEYLMEAWGQSSGATMRLLHRHLVSPQMRNTLLAKRISDFYQVD